MGCSNSCCVPQGAKAQDSFVNSWGVSYGLGQASQWQDILQEVLKGLIILAILERLQLTRHGEWLEEVRATWQA